MSVTFNAFLVDGFVTTAGGNILSFKSDKASSDYCILGIDDKEIKLSPQDVMDIVSLLQRAGSFRGFVK